jgi:hypothetical protein
MTHNDRPARDLRLAVGRRLAEAKGLGRSGLLEPGEHQPPVSFWMPGELLTDNPVATIRALAVRDIAARARPNPCGGVYRVTVAPDTEVCGPQLAQDLDRILGDEGFVGLNHVLTLAQVPRIGPGTDPEPAEKADWGCKPIELPDDWGLTVIDTGLFRPPPSHLATAPDREWELVDFDGGGVVDFSGTGHGGFIGGIVYRMLGVTPAIRDVATRDYRAWTFAITEADILAEVDRALSNRNVNVINLSLGSYERGTELVALRRNVWEWVQRRPDVLFVCAAGNDETDDPFYPAAFSAEPKLAGNIVAVGALNCSPMEPDPSAGKADFSNHGEWVTAWAPGVDHASDYPDGVDFVYGPNRGTNAETATFAGLAHWSGTSFAAPYVAAELMRYAYAHSMQPTEAWRTLREHGVVHFPLESGPCHNGNGKPDPEQAAKPMYRTPS